MEITKEINFKGPLFKNTSVTLSYNGFLADDEVEEIYVKFSFDAGWSDCIQKEMSKTEDGYEIDIELGDNEEIHLCFTDNLDRWDNNDSENYVFQIKEENTELVVTKSSLPYLQEQHGLRKSYIWSKKIRLFLYKIFRSLPRFITGNYRRRLNL